MEIVELILDDSIDSETKKRFREQYCEDNRLSIRMAANYVKRYREKARLGLLFYRSRPKRLRIHDAQLRAKIIELVREIPTCNVPTLRRLLSEVEPYAEKIGCISERTIYRFLAENGLTQRERCRLLRESGRRS